MQILNSPPSKAKYKKYKKGTATSGVTGQMTVTGLGFRPKYVFLNLVGAGTDATNRENTIIVSDEGFEFYNGNIGYITGVKNTSGTITEYVGMGKTTNPITSDGFFLQQLVNSKTYNYIAIA